VLDGGLLYQGAKPGDVLRAEADFEIEGITIVAVAAPKPPEAPEPNRIEIIGPARQDAPGVTTQLVGRGERRPGDRRRDRDETRPRRDRDGGRPSSGRDGSRPGRGGPAGERDTVSRRDDPGRGARPERADRADRADRGERPRRRDDRERRQGASGSEEALPAEGADTGAGRDEQNRGGNRSERRPAAGTRPGRGARRPPDGSEPAPGGGRPGRGTAASRTAERRPHRFSPGHTHRQAMLESLAPEERPVAEQVLRGGIPAVRTALHLEREKAVAEGRPAPNTDQLIAMAEELLPRLKAAEWRDRADAAIKDADEISLRDLRSVVAGADAARDDESRALAAGLREALERRLSTMKVQWEEEVAHHLDERRLVRALRLAGRPPEPAARLDPELAQRLSDAAGEAMSPETASDRWMALIEAVAASPVRRTVKPAGLPADPDPDLLRAAQQQSGRIPALAALLGIAIPPPPQPTASRRPVRPRRPKGEGPAAAGAEPAEPAPPAAVVDAGPAGSEASTEPPGPTATDSEAVPDPAEATPAGSDEARAAPGPAGAAPTEVEADPGPGDAGSDNPPPAPAEPAAPTQAAEEPDEASTAAGEERERLS
jgi:hypothetical protein